MSSIFISYRREDAEGQAGRLYRDLTTEFGSDSVFMDVAAIQFGRDFRTAIDQSLSSCGAFLSIIGKNWLAANDASGRRRLDDSVDFVRLETAAALQRDIPVIPVLVQGASTPRPDQLPDDLKELAYRNAIELTHPRWESDVRLLIEALRPYVSKSPQQAGESNRQNRGTISREERRIEKKRSWATSAAMLTIILAATVGLIFSLWPARQTVPDLQGKMLDPARGVLQAEHLVLGTTEERADPEGTPGSIVAQSVKAGDRVPVGTRIDVTVAAIPKAGSGLANSRVAVPSKHAPLKKTPVPDSKESLGVEGTGLPAANAPPMRANSTEAILRQLQLSAERKPLEQQAGRYLFTLSLDVPKQTVGDISRVHYDFVYEPNPLSLDGGPPPSFRASYEGWGCYTTVVATLYFNTQGAQPVKKTFNMCTVLVQ